MSKSRGLTFLSNILGWPPYRRELIQLLFLYLVAEVPLIGVILYKHEFNITDSTVIIYFLEKILFDYIVFFTINVAILKTLKTPLVSLTFSIFYIILTFANTGTYYFGSTLLEKHHLSLITPYSIAGFINTESVLGTMLMLSVCVFIWCPLRRLSSKITWADFLFWIIIVIVLGVSHPAARYADRVRHDDRLDKRIMVFRNAQLSYSAQNILFSFIRDIIAPGVLNGNYSISGSALYQKYMKKYLFAPDEYRISRDISRYQDIINRYKLGINRKSYEDLGLKPFKRVIMIFVESLSLEMLQCHNKRLKVPTSSFLCSDWVQKQTFRNVMTSGSPTLQGLTVTFFGHPNYQIQSDLGYPNSSVRALRNKGYKTIFLRSASKFFANENITFKKWGFEKIVAREDFYKHPDLRKYIYGWGLEDRILYQYLVDLVDRHRNEKLFISVLGTDTHPLHGKRNYMYLNYPSLPLKFGRTYGVARHFMKAIHHMDYDLGQLVEMLKERKLYTDDTLIVITADHSCPYNSVTRRIPGHTRSSLGKIPFILLTPQALPTIRHDLTASQIDISPTLFHLMGLSIPKGWWGDSLFAKSKESFAIGYHMDMVRIQMGNERQLFRIKEPKTDEETKFKEFFSTVFVPREGN